MKPNTKFYIMLALFAVLILVTGWFLMPGRVFAVPAGTLECASGTHAEEGFCVINNPASGNLVNIPNFGDLLQRIVKIFLEFAGAVAVIFLMVGGFQYVSSRGNEEAMEKAKKTITSAVIGIVLIVMAYAIVTIVNDLLTRTPT